MGKLTPDQRNYYYLLEAERTGIHKPILAALHQTHGYPALDDLETGLGIVPKDAVTETPLETFPVQVRYAANLVRILTDDLTTQGWRGEDFWSQNLGRYSDRFLTMLAQGYSPKAPGTEIACLQSCILEHLISTYHQDLELDSQGQNLPLSFSELDQALLTLVDRIPTHYQGLTHQQNSLLELVRLWRQLDSQEDTLISLAQDADLSPDQLDDAQLDFLLKQFVQRLSPYYDAYPYQREALIRATQLWRQLDSREAAIASLTQDPSADQGLKFLDPALMNFMARAVRYYEGKGSQRNALTEGVRLWRQLDSRSTVLHSLGIDPKVLDQPTEQDVIALDRELLNFIRQIPGVYGEKDHEREALIEIVKLWRGLPNRNQTIESLTEDLKHLEREHRSQETASISLLLPKRPDQWTPDNIHLPASIIPDGNFTWAEATGGGTRMPPNQETVNGIIRIAKLAQQARDRIGRPFMITRWYCPPHINQAIGDAKYSHHSVGDAINFTCENLTGNQLYWLLDPWWSGGLGQYRQFPYLCYLDARNYRARWNSEKL